MLAALQKFIRHKDLFHAGDLLIVATSGGKDSMALLHYLKMNGYKFIVAHCNFKLREHESDADQQFIEQYCSSNEITFETIEFDTKSIAQEQKESIQITARGLRYDWLELLRQKYKAHCIVTGHHLNDNIETLMFNLVKGTGIKGIRGIKVKNGYIVRPLLETSVDEIWDYIQSNGVPYREDASNASNKYDRNKIRHEVVPVFTEINNNLSGTFKEHFKRWLDIEAYHKAIIEEWRNKLLVQKKEDIFISITKIKQLKFNKSLMFEILAPYNFNNSDIENLMHSLDSKDLKFFESSTHRILKDRKFLILTKLQLEEPALRYIIKKTSKKLQFGNSKMLQFHVRPLDKLARISAKANYAFIDIDYVNFPLILRKWELGDYLYPFGLNKASGKPSKKKVNKLLRDEKISQYEKDDTWVLCSGDKLIWLVGHRLDDRFKLTNKTKEVLTIELKHT
jgi:tRNA(Ile)-lysidine synthase